MGCFARGLLFGVGLLLLLPGACFLLLGAGNLRVQGAGQFVIIGLMICFVAVVLGGAALRSGDHRRVSKVDDMMRVLDEDERRQHRD